MIESTEFAKYIIFSAGDGASSINMTKLQKYLYICDGFLLAFGFNVIRENPKAWDYGPVYPKVYKWYKDKVGISINKNDISPVAVKEIEENHFDTAIKKVFEIFKGWTAGELSAWTHQPNSPWSNAIDRGMYSTIDKNDMRMYFSGVFNVK